MALTAGESDLLVVKAQVGYREGGRETDTVHEEGSFLVRKGVFATFLLKNGGADERLAVTVGHETVETGFLAGRLGAFAIHRNGVSVDDEFYILPGKDLGEYFVKRLVLGRDGNPLLKVNHFGVHDNGVVALRLKAGYRLLDSHIFQLERHVLGVEAQRKQQDCQQHCHARKAL